jgi:hypothetical protein
MLNFILGDGTVVQCTEDELKSLVPVATYEKVKSSSSDKKFILLPTCSSQEDFDTIKNDKYLKMYWDLIDSLDDHRTKSIQDHTPKDPDLESLYTLMETALQNCYSNSNFYSIKSTKRKDFTNSFLQVILNTPLTNYDSIVHEIAKEILKKRHTSE